MKQLLFFTFILGYAYALPPRIVNGTFATPGEIPYIVSLRSYGSHICGGSILDARHVLTAAHCASPYDSNLSIQYGVTEISTGSHNSINVAKVVQHDEYSSFFPYPNDVAVLTLETGMQFSKFASPVVLPGQGEEPVANSASLLAGWGYTGHEYPTKLYKVTLKVYSPEDCTAAHGPEVNGVHHLCSGVVEGWKGQCSGDSGGPLVSAGKQIGSVSWSVKPCAIVGYPGVYARTASYSNWISRRLED